MIRNEQERQPLLKAKYSRGPCLCNISSIQPTGSSSIIHEKKQKNHVTLTFDLDIQ